MEVSAQVSLYPLRQQDLGPSIDQAVAALRGHVVKLEVGTMSTMMTGDIDAVFGALRDGFAAAADRGELAMVITVSNGC